ncbi:MAG: MMPL family transporter, partial [Gammaproteobacteria bacterium]|nr:MMPL family transporter [Gammaproteobacteria bacterium]
MSERVLHAYERIVLLHPKLVLSVVLLVTLGLAMGLPNFKLDASADSLTLENDNDLDYFREINERYGSGDFLVVTYSPLADDDLFSDKSLATLTELTQDLKQIEDVVNVVSMINVPLLYSPKVPVSQLHDTPRTLLTRGVDREMAKQEFLNSPVFSKLILGPEGQTTALLASIKVDQRYIDLVRGRDALRYKRKTEGLSAEEAIQLATISQEFLDYRTERAVVEKARVKAVRALMDNYRDRAQIFLGGPSMITADMVDFIRSDLEVFGAGITLFIVITLAVIFRQIRWVMLPLATCGFAIVMMLGWLSWIDWRLTVISSNFVALLLVLTMALTIHLIVRYRELHHEKPEASQLELVRDMVRFMARPCIYTVLTTIVAFASLVVSGIRPVIDFGWMMTIGLTVSLVLGFLVIPAGMLVLGKAKVVQAGSKGGQLPAHFSNFTERHGTLVLVLSLVISLISVVGISKLQVDNRFIDYFKEHTEIYQGLSIIDQKLGGTTPLDIIIQAPASANIPLTLGVPEKDDPFGEEDPFEDDPFGDDVFGEADPNQQKPSYWFSRGGLEELEEITTYLDDMDEIGRIDSLVTVFHVANDLTGHRMNDFELAVMRKSLSPEMNRFLLAPYLNDETDETRLTMRTVESGSTLNRQQLLDEINSFLIDEVGLEPEQFRLSGLMVLYNNMLQSLFHSQIVTLGAVFLGIMLMFVVLFRSLLIAFIAVFPNILAACVVLGVMGWAGIPLDM